MSRAGAIAVLAGLVLGLYLLLYPPLPKSSGRSGERQTSSLPQDLVLDSSSERGHRLAQIYCQSCHLFPEPALLDKATWEKGAFPDMAPWLGLAKPKLERRRDGEVIAEADVFP